MDDLNKKIALRMQEMSKDIWQSIASLLPYGSYTASQVYDYFSKDYRGREKSFKDIMNGLDKVCHQEITINVENFKCSAPKYLFFKILHKFEQLAGIKTKDKKKFIREASIEKQGDVSFVVEITKPMMALTKVLPCKKEFREQMKRIALDFDKGFVVACDGCMMSVMNAVFRQKEIKDGAKVEPVLLSPDTFKHCEGNTMVSMSEINGCPHKYRVMTEGGAYYEEDTVGRYVAWRSVVPNEYFRSGRITLSKDGMKQLLKFAKLAEKNADHHGEGKDMILQTEGNKLIVYYWAKGKIQSQNISLDYEPASVTICLDPKYFKYLSGWNGTMWISGYGRAVIFDCDEYANFHLLMPRIIPDGVDVKEELTGTKVLFEERHCEYYQPKQIEQETKINNPITPIFMAAERYEGTEPFYQLDKIENGEFRVKGNHDSDLVLFLRTAAHYIRRQGEMMQSEFCAYCSKQLEGKDWRSMVPMEELALAEMFEGFLASKGVNDIPDVEFEDVMEEVTEEVVEEVEEEPIAEVEEAEEVEEVEAEEVEDIQEAEEVIEEVEEPQSYVLCITGTLNKSRKFYQEQIEMRGWRLAGKMSTSVDILVYGDSKDEQASTKIKQAIKHGTKAISAEEFYQMLDEHPVEVEDVVGETEVAIKPMAIEKEIVPTLELETSEGTLIVAGDSYFHKLYDEENGCFRSEAAEAKFNEIDAFIPDELITAEVLDYAAIAQAVGEFMEEVEQAS